MEGVRAASYALPHVPVCIVLHRLLLTSASPSVYSAAQPASHTGRRQTPSFHTDCTQELPCALYTIFHNRAIFLFWCRRLYDCVALLCGQNLCSCNGFMRPLNHCTAARCARVPVCTCNDFIHQV